MSTTDYGALVQDDRVHTALYKDGAIFEEEMERIFKNTWIWVGHESELPGANTFKKSFVGSQPVFVCPYHGWSYDIDGGLREVPYGRPCRTCRGHRRQRCRVDARLRQIAAEAVAEENSARSTELGKVSVEFQSIGNRPAGNTSETGPLAQGAFAASRAFGYAPQFIAVSTDANIPMSMGIPAIAIGSGGSGGGEHTAAEAIDVEINESVRGISVGLATLVQAARK